MLRTSLARKNALALLVWTSCALPLAARADDQPQKHDDPSERHDHDETNVSVGARPYYLVDKLSPGPLKTKLQSCSEDPVVKTNFSIGHRGGATLQFPEHTKENHEAGARMGAGIQECDVTFTKDKQLVCRHDQCDLHTTTNILTTPLAAQCTQAFAPAQFDASGKLAKAASALCCTSDLTVAEFKSLQGKMDAFDPRATTPQQFQGGTASWRTDLFSTGATLLTHKESIELLRKLGSNYTPERKAANRAAKLQVEAVFGSQASYAQALVDDYKAANISARKVWPQSFNKDDILYWVSHEPQFGKQAAFLDDANVPADVPSATDLNVNSSGRTLRAA